MDLVVTVLALLIMVPLGLALIGVTLYFIVATVLVALMYIGKGAEWLLNRMLAAQAWFDRRFPYKGAPR